jgi:hypothetical protein
VDPVAISVNDQNAPMGGYVAQYHGSGMGDQSGRAPHYWTVAHLNARHNIYFTSTTPATVTFRLRDAAPHEGVMISLYYGTPNRVEVYVEGNRIFPMHEPTWDDPNITNLTMSMPTGTNIWDRLGRGGDNRPGYMHVIVKGPTPVVLKVTPKLKLTKFLEVGEQEFVYQTGSQGMTRNVALLMNIPETRIKVVGLGAMMDGEIWNKFNGVSGGYKPESGRSVTFRGMTSASEGGGSLLQQNSTPLSFVRLSKEAVSARLVDVDVAEFVFDPSENMVLDDLEATARDLFELETTIETLCRTQAMNCSHMDVDELDVPGWTCKASSYDTGDGCDCNCGIWDPDCDLGSSNPHFEYGMRYGGEGTELTLLERSAAETALTDLDSLPRNHRLQGTELDGVSMYSAGSVVRRTALLLGAPEYAGIFSAAQAADCTCVNKI